MKQLTLLGRHLGIRIQVAHYEEDLNESMAQKVVALKGKPMLLYLR